METKFTFEIKALVILSVLLENKGEIEDHVE